MDIMDFLKVNSNIIYVLSSPSPYNLLILKLNFHTVLPSGRVSGSNPIQGDATPVIVSGLVWEVFPFRLVSVVENLLIDCLNKTI